MLKFKVTGEITVSPLATSENEFKEGLEKVINEWLRGNVCNYQGGVSVELVEECEIKNVINYFAISTEKGKTNGNIIGNTKQGACKGMTREQFASYLGKTTWESFEIKEMKADYSEHRKFLKDKW